ncbi:MAG: methionine--tRNA ligase [Rhodospirillaceae bacterium]|jgi:methionyl-tRNA synthetase|nr:methionine--tRNA ligase [Rhodospirillaceae bacterium]MBT3494604.1 methionine--tRNA ligase [Rhodospirillaceae bacterium]MBT3782617.1 methionine--tRNA ligase [Rhodospirillaceae bacterium]MBT3974910.1 methionine--tRNA ligase [Rhodospirillaceae bacterium]MBT4169945.1 methionine--tRNA ligase [Rhodospirillaceae bacterium]
MAEAKAYYITTPIYYVNDKPHIGHAYTTLACDVIARFMRLDGRDVMFMTGTDEHGQKVEKSAQAAGVEPLAFCDGVSQNFRDLTPMLNFTNDGFIRTTEDRHTQASQAIWQAMADNGDIYLDSYAGWYSVRDEAYYAEDELTDGANGEKLSPFGAPVEWVEEPSYFFRLSEWQDRLLAYYDEDPGRILPQSRRNEVISFVKSGLRDLSISRTSFKWGVPVPGDDAHIMYVWVDALTNYLTAVGYPDTDADSFKTYWPADVHMVGKDILRFHAVYWPAFLMSAGLAPPKRIFAHGWWTVEGQKMSKSLGNFIPPQDLVDKYGLDQTRYFMMRELPFGNDGNFSHGAMVNRMNSDLANDFGNLAQRVLSMINKNCEGTVPTPALLSVDDGALLVTARELVDKMRAAMDVQGIHHALTAMWEVVGDANRYVDAQAPWGLKKTDPERMATVLYVLAEVIRHLAILAQPVVPDAAARMLDQLAVPEQQRSFDSLGDQEMLLPGTALPKPQGIFPRYSGAEEDA